MKQQIHKWLRPMLCFALLAAAACSDDDTDAAASRPVPPVLQTDIPAEGYHFVYFKQEPRTFTMTVDAPWEITKTAGWFVVTPKTGKAGENIRITIEGDLNTAEARTGEFTIRANSGNFRYPCIAEQTVRLTQDAFRSAGISISGLESYRDRIVDFPADKPQPVTFSVTASYDWTIEVSDASWVAVTPLKGGAGYPVQVTVAPTANTTREARSSELAIVCFDPENPENRSEELVTLRQSRMADTHAAGYVFFEDDFDWITPLWDASKYNQLYGWPTVDDSDFHFFTAGANTAVGAKAAELGYTFNGSVYGRYLGFVKLGKTNENGILTTRALNGIDRERNATLLVEFDGAYYMTAAGTVDNGTAMKVTVVGDGTIDDPEATDEGRSLTIPMLHAFAWDRYAFVVKDATSATQIQFCDGVAASNIKTRLFLDNVKITRADDETAEAPGPEAVVLPLAAAVDPMTPAEIDFDEQTLAYTVRVNRAWEIASDAEWLTIDALTSGIKSPGAQGAKIGADKLSATAPATELLYNVRLKAARNDGEARTGRISLKADGKTIGSIEVRQAENTAENTLTVEGLADNAAELGYDRTAADASVTFTVNSTTEWSAATDDAWYTLTPASGQAGKTEVTLRAAETNRGTRRFGRFAIAAKNNAELSTSIAVSQAPAAQGSAPWDLSAPIQWKFSAADMPKYIPEFANDKQDYYPADMTGNTRNALPSETADGPGYIAYAHNSLAIDVNNKCARIIGATGEPYVTGAWPGDWWMFTVPVKSLAAGTSVHFKGTSKTSGTGMKYWLMEYEDGGVWKPVAETKTATVDGAQIVYTQEHMNTTALKVDFTVTFSQAIADGAIRFRYTCAANAQASGKGALKAPNGGTHRWQEPLTIEIVQ